MRAARSIARPPISPHATSPASWLTSTWSPANFRLTRWYQVCGRRRLRKPADKLIKHALFTSGTALRSWHRRRANNRGKDDKQRQRLASSEQFLDFADQP